MAATPSTRNIEPDLRLAITASLPKIFHPDETRLSLVNQQRFYSLAQVTHPFVQDK
jgi:hypothetical protein